MESTASHLDGGCACGEVRYRIQSRPMFTHCCHCRDCQRQSGSAFALNALIEAERVELTNGTPEAIMLSTGSGAGQEVYRCPNCRVALWSYYLMFPGGIERDVRFLRVGTLDDPDLVPPDIHIYATSKQPWFSIPVGAPTVDRFYPIEETWPTESLQRRNALIERKK